MTETIDDLLGEGTTPAVEVTEPVLTQEQPTEAAPEFAAAVAEADDILDALMARIGTAETTNQYLRVMLYGPPGVRKTTFSAGSPRPLIYEVDAGGSKSLLNHPDLRNTPVLPFKSMNQCEVLIQKLGENNKLSETVDTLVIDTFSELQIKDLDRIVQDAAAKDASRNKFLPIGPDYNINTEHMRQIADNLRNLPKHVIITCHVKEEKDDSTGRVLIRPNLTPKLARTMAGMFDVVGYMNVDGDNWTLQVHPTTSVSAKTRLGGLPPVINDPTFQMLLDALSTRTGE